MTTSQWILAIFKLVLLSAVCRCGRETLGSHLADVQMLKEGQKARLWPLGMCFVLGKRRGGYIITWLCTAARYLIVALLRISMLYVRYKKKFPTKPKVNW